MIIELLALTVLVLGVGHFLRSKDKPVDNPSTMDQIFGN